MRNIEENKMLPKEKSAQNMCMERKTGVDGWPLYRCLKAHKRWSSLEVGERNACAGSPKGIPMWTVKECGVH
ncbi:hypothetical protein DPEC_G00295210 [Dallia pectoralis]|uniref:Uncharacterized protein n=1 Tax=Dallia pectoralis TaxID=75939 RepID=A0ACC2FIP5_DALPE|nr:hypothetical protein DPEC_G00295210 [Dallia pectoralis]